MKKIIMNVDKGTGLFAVINTVGDFLAKEREDTVILPIFDGVTAYQEQKGDDVFLYYFKPINRQLLSDDSVRHKRVPWPYRRMSMYCKRLYIMFALSPNCVFSRRSVQLTIWSTPEFLPPAERNRKRACSIIQKYFQLTDEINTSVQEFAKDFFSNHHILGLHIRSPGRCDIATTSLRVRYTLENGVPFEAYFKKVNAYIEKHPNVKIFVCSDSQDIVERVCQEYGERVITYDAERTAFGEPHVPKKNPGVPRLSPRKVGEGVIVEAWLLSMADYFIHGNSNVSNFALCLNPDIPHDDIYAPFYSVNQKGLTYVYIQLRSIIFKVLYVFLWPIKEILQKIRILS